MSIEGHRRLVQVIPDPVQEWWDKWEIGGLVLLSLMSQIILTILGDRTKYKPNILTRPLLWSAYLLADWVAAVAMGVISSNVGDYYNKGEQPKNVNPQLLAFWAPFFLMHLGGPDTITAYALEDNELWLRHFVGLLSQTVLTVYIIILSWKGNWLSHLTILMLIIGIIKYGERTWSLYCGSIKHLRDSFLCSIYTSRKRGQLLDSKFRYWNKMREQRTYLRAIYIFVSLFVDLVMIPRDDFTPYRRQFLNLHINPEYNESFSFVSEHNKLKLMYDVFYTKAFANYGILGFMSRLITLTTTIVVLVSYTNLSEKKEHLLVDHIITYFLLVGALIAETYAFILVARSTWTLYYFVMKGPIAFFTVIMCCVICRGNREKNEVQFFWGQCNFFNLVCNKNLNIEDNFFTLNKLEELPSVSHCLIVMI